MLFNSYIFILLFLPGTLIGYWLIHKLNVKFANFFLLLMSIIFYGYSSIKYLCLFAVSIVVNYMFGYMLSKEGKQTKSNLLLFGAIVCNLSIIFYYKYSVFLIENINYVFDVGIKMKTIILPLGISFFTFQQISYIVDIYNGEKNCKFADYALYVSFFPQLVAGPICKYKAIIKQFQDNESKFINWENIANGIVIFVIGFGKKIILADSVGQVVDFGFQNISALSSVDAVLVMLACSFQIYFDFCGYSEMAYGMALMFNIILPENFHLPYKAEGIIDFWKRWHISLTDFLREYVYIPLGGNRKGFCRQYVNIFILFLLSGIWHGANWTFILWGIIHGILNILERVMGSPLQKVPKYVKQCLTFAVVSVLWLLFRADSISDFTEMVRRLVDWSNVSVNQELVQRFSFLSISGKYAMIFIMGFSAVICAVEPPLLEVRVKKNFVTAFILATFFAFLICSLSNVSVFLYFNF